MIHFSRLLPLFLLTVGFAGAVPLVSFSDTWEYREGTSAPQAGWQTLADESLDATWRSGPGWIGYGDGSGADAAGTTLSGMRNNYRTFLIRRT
jgi:hypothetical protein